MNLQCYIVRGLIRFFNTVLTRYVVTQNIYMLSSRYIYIYIYDALYVCPAGSSIRVAVFAIYIYRINVVKIIRIDYMNLYNLEHSRHHKVIDQFTHVSSIIGKQQFT